MSKATIYDVAGAARAWLATVSRAINNPEKVKPETRERVLRVIKELGYKPNAFAKGLASRKSTTVAVVVPDMGRASIAEMMNGIADIARVYKYSILLYILESEDASEEDILREIIAAQVDGILYLNDEINEEQYHFLKEVKNNYQIPIVLTNTFYPGDDEIPSVSIDYERAGYEITKKLIEENNKEIQKSSEAFFEKKFEELSSSLTKEIQRSNEIIFAKFAALHDQQNTVVHTLQEAVKHEFLKIYDNMLRIQAGKPIEQATFTVAGPGTSQSQASDARP